MILMTLIKKLKLSGLLWIIS